MTTFRRYTLQDIDPMLDHIKHFLKESPKYKDMYFDKDKMLYLLTGNVKNSKFFCDIAFNKEKIVGGLCAGLQEYLTNHEVYAYDLLFYIPPDRRSLAIAKELVTRYVTWAKERGAKEVRLASTTGTKLEGYDKLRERFGFSLLGNIYSMEL